MKQVAPLLAFLLALSSCLSRPPISKQSCKLTMSWTADQTFHPDERRAIETAMDIWTAGTEGRACFYEGGQDIRFIRVQQQRDLCPFDPGCMNHVGLHTAGRIWLVVGEMLSERYMVATTVHEIGHAMSLSHQESGCMTRVINEGCIGAGRLSPADLRTFCEKWGCAK